MTIRASLPLPDNVQDIVNSKNVQDIVNSRLGDCVVQDAVIRASSITKLIFVFFDLDRIQEEF